MTKRKSRPGRLEPFVPPAGSEVNTGAQALQDDGWAFPYKMFPDGLYRIDDQGGKVAFISQPFEVLGKSRDMEGNGWGLGVKFLDDDKNEKMIVLARADLCSDHNEAGKMLSHAGFFYRTGQHKYLKDALANFETSQRITIVEQSGWISPGADFILGRDAIIRPDSPASGKAIYYRIGDAPQLLVNGSLDGWRSDVSIPCIGNSRLVLAVCAAFAGPLLGIFGKDGFGFHIRGASTSGKSTALQVASSVSGRRNGSWRATGNALEALAAAANDGLITLDELKEALSHEVAAIVYMLANGTGKARSNRGSNGTKMKVWRTIAFSTGEISLAQKISEGNPRSTSHAGHEVRLVDIEADAGTGTGLFETIPSDVKPKDFAERLSASAAQNSGYALRPFIEALQRDGGQKARLLYSHIQRAFLGEWNEIDGQAGRVLDHFAIVAAAGEFATECGLTGWASGEATKAAKACFSVWLKPRAAGNHESRVALDAVRAAIQVHGASRFHDSNEDKERNIPQVMGHKREINGILHYCFLSEVWKRDVLAGQDFKAAARYLKQMGLLSTDPDRLTKKIRVMESSQNVYAVSAKILEGDDL